MAETVNSYPLDKDSNDASSLCTDTTSIYPASRPVSKHMGEPPRSPMPPASKRKSLTNSISYFLGAATSTKTLGRPPRPASALEMIYNHEEGVASRVYSSRRYSTSDVLQTAMHAQEMRDPLPPIDPLSLLGLGFDLESSVSIAQSEEQHSTESSPTPATFNHLPHRLSIMSASERASTLIGNESEHDFGSDTLFDSVRTRISQMTPIRADRIFDLPPVVMQPSYDPGSNDSRVTIQGYHDALESPTPESVQTTRRLGVNIVHDDEEDGWSSDWDMPSRDDGGLRPFDKLSRLGLELHSNASNTSFGTARERFSTDGSSMRETNSILDWNDGVSMNQASSAANSCRSRTIHTKESLLSMSRKGRRSIKYHRSQSMPLTNTSLRGRTTVPSENWDDDFFDEEDDGFGLGEMIIPRAIEERQASIIGHLGCVREFALLVEGEFGDWILPFSRVTD